MCNCLWPRECKQSVRNHSFPWAIVISVAHMITFPQPDHVPHGALHPHSPETEERVSYTLSLPHKAVFPPVILWAIVLMMCDGE